MEFTEWIKRNNIKIEQEITEKKIIKPTTEREKHRKPEFDRDRTEKQKGTMNEWCLRWNTFIFDNSLFWFSFGPFFFFMQFHLICGFFTNVCLEHSKICSFFFVHSNTQNQIAKLMLFSGSDAHWPNTEHSCWRHWKNYFFLSFSFYGIKKQVCTHITFKKCNQFFFGALHCLCSFSRKDESNFRLIFFFFFI